MVSIDIAVSITLPMWLDKIKNGARRNFFGLFICSTPHTHTHTQSYTHSHTPHCPTYANRCGWAPAVSYWFLVMLMALISAVMMTIIGDLVGIVECNAVADYQVVSGRFGVE